jgi:geranylgeranyl pyrophosphate synthase
MGGILTGADDADTASLQAAGVDLGHAYQFLDANAPLSISSAWKGEAEGLGVSSEKPFAS